MSRPRKKLDERKEGSQVLERLQQESPGWKRERLLALKLGLEGEASLEDIAAAVGHARSTIQAWFELYREKGLERVLRLERGKGPPSQLTASAAAALHAGLAVGQWRTAAQVQAFLERDHGVTVSLPTVYAYLGKSGARLRVPRPVHLKKDPAAAEAFKRELATRLAALHLEPKRRVRVWVMDEMRCGLHTEPRRVWGLRGQRPVVTVQQKYEWQYVYGALEVGRSGVQFLYAPSVSLEWNQAFLAQIAAHDPESVHVVIYDGAGFHHRDGAPEVPANVRLITLPPYSPELNPVEKLWNIVRDGICNRVFASLQELTDGLTAVLSRFWRNARAVFSLIGSGWLLSEANASGAVIIPV